MDRRGFFKLCGAGVAGIALEQAIPLGRVWSFPSKIVVSQNPEEAALAELNSIMDKWAAEPLYAQLPVGSLQLIRVPQRFFMKKVIGQRLYEVTVYPGAIPFKIIDSDLSCTAPASGS